MSNRRDFLKKSGILGLSVVTSGLIAENKIKAIEQVASLGEKRFTLPPLPYSYDALEPFIDKQTMELHHTKHHQAYIDKINSADAAWFGDEKDLSKLCAKIDGSSPALIRNNLGGHYNHSLFWTLLQPNSAGKINSPEGALLDAIKIQFGSFDDFKKDFSDKALKIFGSGWCWLILADGKLKTVTTSNQDNPLMNLGSEKGKVILALDVWEHAYYLKYQNKRTDYIAGWWNVVNWKAANELFVSN